ncbi:MAG: outer membrane protein assembly factor BamE [Verrucomicrobiaceae bacterium]|nr:MAG: outer membrane protein assembly factor BamE [Verrucomicrobiaceae bacterium]
MSRSAVRVGMTWQEVREQFGSPVRTVRKKDGREEWHYPLSWQETQERTDYQEPRRGGDGTLGFPDQVESSSSFTTERSTRQHEASVDLDPAGRVEAVPRGTIVRKPR